MTLPITKVPRTGLPARALLVGDQTRAASVAERLTDGREVARNREYHTYAGTWRDVPVVVSSHGVGGPGALCLFQELRVAGVRAMLRLGTAGAFRSDIAEGDLVIAEGAVRDDGVTQQLVPAEYPAFSTPEAVLALAGAAREHAAPAHRGIVWTRAAFSPGALRLPTDEYIQSRVIAIEMELSTLLVDAAMHGVTAGGVLVIDGNAVDDHPDPTAYDPHRTVVADGVSRGIHVALDALVALDV
ncbi:nucleoside phosphorylase [Spiractinospora alimapuensis]|uniref:nucleoside phosphorylase n=1 Tax=Spiractinospora alimapuensis TaxID=2820884 RepID=UPI001F2ECA39|nr:nucleoside phosphorylase [Spiractinospora alimapuensis]QVQ50073.1 nucleoside phosphorylase [Spiractinospora alimapuensis]